ncbi:hypothetical protein A4H97_32050 [Niastella yeongjuensis]|uniref:Uncharacterized protein n=1 Tax=Niastella yeongjuensis TaxID=354355 RepID=A0A1V9EJ13_9BACT|nr:hypothetical protein [Niastella yeongjuensis]OQP45875.1 hypothetical protein A4H97_32050 [Niastella yeongjuensis]SEP46738.1 hypothetical protein SAMN05660816_06493 [Niastella yeongjuensis]
MKSHNLHPVWYNQPLRLNEDQLNSPELALDDFFEFYHLKEVREILWQWVREVVSSPGSILSDHQERNNHLFFYEKLEMLVEAAWVINGGRGEQTGRYAKPERLIEKAAKEPTAVIEKVFSEVLLTDLQEDLLPNWLQVTLANPASPYADRHSREVLNEFYERLFHFVGVLHGLSTSNQYDDLSAVTDFFQRFSIEYIQRELTDFFEAAIGYKENYPNGFTPWLAWMTYNNIVCLVEAAYQLYKNGVAKTTTGMLGKIAEPKPINFLKNV